MGGRILAAAPLAALVTLGLFFLMQSLISMHGGALEDKPRTRVIDFVRLKRERELELKHRERPEKETPPEPPPPPELQLSRTHRPDAELRGVAPTYDLGLDLEGPVLGAPPADTDVVPLVRVQPQYPLHALERGIEGWVEVRFTISAAGTVKDPEVTASEPGSMFDRAALRAIRRWKYNPMVVDGKAVEREGVKVRLVFELE
jgi:protein TonB